MSSPSRVVPRGTIGSSPKDAAVTETLVRTLATGAYLGQQVWKWLRSRQGPETGRRVSELKPLEEWIISEKPDLQILEDGLWERVQARQDLIDSSCTRAERKANAGRVPRRPRAGASIFCLDCQCGGKMTVAGKGERRRYYCANAKEKVASVCTGMPGVKESTAAEALLSG